MSRAEVTALRERCLRMRSRGTWGEGAALAVLLGCSHFAADHRLYRHVSADGVDWDRVLGDRTWSTSERFILGTAAGLWGGRPTLIDISRMAFLDERMHTLWQDMLTAAWTGRLPEGR